MNLHSKCITGLAILLSTIHSVSAMKMKVYQLPSASKLKERFSGTGLDHFIEKTNLNTILGDQKKHALGVATAVELALYDYNEYIKDPLMQKLMQMNKPRIIQLSLQDYPEAIEELEKEGVLSPAKKI